MSAELRGYLKRQIIDHGPLDVGAFMAIALGHPRYGYYMGRDPLGRGGDFTTAPEISQMFGELIGVWCADTWAKLGSPERFLLVECGPGRGTLMADAMRATKKVPGFHAAARLALVEISPALREAQANRLSLYQPDWLAQVNDIGPDGPVLLVANEFLDALPVRQFVKTARGWGERRVGLNGGGFAFGLGPAPSGLTGLLPEAARDAEEGSVFEVSPARSHFARDVARRLAKSGGAALFIDYGYERRAAGDTLQAVYRHDHCGVLDHIGDADLSAHVDFEALAEAASKEGVLVAGPVSQGDFLQSLGIKVRAQALAENASERQKGDIASALQRLTGKDAMGGLFRAMAIYAGDPLHLSGF